MPGARIVWNTRYFHIARVGEKADGKHSITKDAAMGLVNYVGTREGVELNVPEQMKLDVISDKPLNLDPLKLRPEVASKPATGKQLDTIAKLLEQFPEAKNTFEYEDFKANSTIGNASELISRAAEIGLGFAVDVGEATNLVEYVGKRPGADRVGEHGLFSSEPNVDIKKAQEEIANCKGNIWTHVVSLRREDADALGYDHQKPWRDLVMQKINVIAEASNIPVSEFHWYAGMHNTSHHPHIHLFVFSDNPKTGKLTVKGINKMKQEFSKEIFAEERLHIYEHKTEMRDSIKQKIDEILSGIENNESDQFSKKELDALCGKLLHLSHDLEGKSGKLQYGYLKKDKNLKDQINGIMSDLAKAPAIQELYALYCEDHKDLQRMYRNNPKDVTPIIKDKEFDSIKNKIIQAAKKLANTFPDFELGESFSPLSDDESLFASVPDERPDNELFQENDQLAELELLEDFEQKHPDINNEKEHKSVPPEDTFEQCLSKAMNGDVNARYRLAKMYFYGKGVEKDFAQAQMWFGLAAAQGHSRAKYELGKMYLYGIGIEQDVKLGSEYCYDAYRDFRYSVYEIYRYDVGEAVDNRNIDDIPGNQRAAYLMYCLGRMEYAGEGVKRDYGKAFRWFQLAADSGHIQSKYRLGKMYYNGEGITQNYSNAKYCYEEVAKGKDKHAYYELGKMYDTGIGVEQNYTKAAEWFLRASQENVPYADYRLGQMFSIGQGVEKDEELSNILYRKALNEFIKQEKRQPNAANEFRIANMYLRGLGVEVNPDEAVKWLELCCEKNDFRAQYQLAELYQDGQVIGQDEAKARELYATALAGFLLQEQESPNNQLESLIGSMFLSGKGTEANLEKALRWFELSAETGNAYAAYCAGRIFERSRDILNNEIQSHFYYSLALNGFVELDRQKPDANMEYRIGQIYSRGIGIDAARKHTVAFQWFLQSAEKNNALAQFQVARMLQNGIGVDKNEQKAQEWYSKAFQGFTNMLKSGADSNLQYKIGTMYEFGLGVEKSTDTAKVWYRIAAEGGNEYAAERLQQIKEYETSVAIHSVFGLFRAFSRGLGNNIQDSTTRKYRQDHKLLMKQRQQKAAQGHKFELKESL